MPPGRAIVTATSVARATAVSAFRAHVAYYSIVPVLVRKAQIRRHPKMPPDVLAYAARRWCCKDFPDTMPGLPNFMRR